MKRNIELLRKLLFWSVDWLQGKPVSTHYKQIKRHFDFPKNLNQNNAIDKLLNHSIETTGYYKHVAKQTPLDGFPVINKTIIRGSFNDFISNVFNSNELILVVTSGSTGTPFKTYQDKNKKNRNYADTIYFAGLAGFEIGHRLLYLKIWAKQKMKSPVSYWLQNMNPVDVIKLDEKQISGLIKEMESNTSTFSILGYSSALELVCQYLNKYHSKKVKANVSSIITISESLNDYTRNTLEKYFNTKVVSRYSNLENGIIAQQEKDSDLFLVNTASYFLEIFHPNKDELLPDGELGRIVVTDLFNYAMPMIRYDTGDFGIRIQRDGKTYLQTVEGRKLDLLFDTRGNMVSSYIMYKNMWQYTEIEQYQLVQTHLKTYEFKINCPNGFKREEQLLKEFKEYLGQDAEIRVSYVNEIPLLNSGKRRKTVNLFYK